MSEAERVRKLEQYRAAYEDLRRIASEVRSDWLGETPAASLEKQWASMAALISFVDHSATPASWLSYVAYRGRDAALAAREKP